MDDAIYMSQVLKELYFGKNGISSNIPVELKIDSKTLYDSINSSKQVDEKPLDT